MRSLPPPQQPRPCRLFTDIKPSRHWLPNETGSWSHIWLFPHCPCWSAWVLSKDREGTVRCGRIHFLTSGGANALLCYCDKSITRVCVFGGWGGLCRQAVNWQSSPQIAGPAILSGGGWWGVGGFIMYDPTGPTFVIACHDEEFAPLAPPFITPPPSEWPWQGMLGPAGHAGNAIGHS